MPENPTSKPDQPNAAPAEAPIYWRVEGSLLELSAIRQVGFFIWNTQSYAERWRRRAGMLLKILLWPLSYLAGRTFAARLLYTLLRGVSRDRLDLLGEEYFEYFLKGRLRQEAVDALRQAQSEAKQIVLVGQSLDHVLRPLARHLGVRHFVANRMEFRDGVATGRLLSHVPDVGKITLLIRRNRTTSAQRRFEKIVEESPTLDGLQRQHGSRLGEFLRAKIEVVEGDVSQPGLGLEESVRARLSRSLDLVVNSAGLTDFNPDLRDAVSSNVESDEHLLNFIRSSDHSALMHLSTCYVVGMRDGRVSEELQENYNPAGVKNFDAEREIASLRETMQNIEERSESPELARALRRQALGRGADESRVAAGELDGVLKRNRSRWVRNKLTQVGMRRAQYLGWPNTYTFTKTVGESILAREGKDLPIAIVRPSIVESSTRTPFSGWNEGINTSGPLSYLLGTNFRQLPSNAKKCLDVIPVDMVCHGMTLIAAALVERKNARMYQLATSGINPCDMGRCIELTGLAHRKHSRTHQGNEHWLKVKFETIPVSKQRYERLSIPMQNAVVSAITPFA